MERTANKQSPSSEQAKTAVRLTKRDKAKMLVPALTIVVCLAVFYCLPNLYPVGYQAETYGPFLFICLGVYVLIFIAGLIVKPLGMKLAHLSWLFMAVFLIIELLDVLTLKTGIGQLPFVPSPDKTLSTMVSQFSYVMECLGSSLELLWFGILIGIVTGTISGILIGWSHFCDYWVMAVLRIIGPIPSAVWIPIAMTIMPSSRAAALFIISLAVWFPLTLMLGSSIKNTEKRYVEVARCLGAKKSQLLFRVAWPHALPAFFDGLFMGFAASFGALVVVEMLGAQSGLGFLISWAKSWAQFSKMYCAVIVLIVVFSSIMIILSIIRKRVLRWHRDTVGQ